MVGEFRAVLKIKPRAWMRTEGKGKRRYMPKPQREYYEMIRYMLMQKGMPRIAGDIRMKIQFYRRDKRKIDMDNMVKALNDALHPYFDDSQIVASCEEKNMGAEEDMIKLHLKWAG